MKYQHNNKIEITRDNYLYVREYKKQLLQNITNLLNILNIRFVISHGNLIEYERNLPIFHDDDVDIRFCYDDISKLDNYFNTIKDNNDIRYNLSFRNMSFLNLFNKNDKNLNNKVSLIKFDNYKNLTLYDNININLDLVANKFNNSLFNHSTIGWLIYNINYNDLRIVKYLDVNTYAPNKIDTINVLTQEYGTNYIIPKYNYKI
jgi:hypothetical protein